MSISSTSTSPFAFTSIPNWIRSSLSPPDDRERDWDAIKLVLKAHSGAMQKFRGEWVEYRDARDGGRLGGRGISHCYRTGIVPLGEKRQFGALP